MENEENLWSYRKNKVTLQTICKTVNNHHNEKTIKEGARSRFGRAQNWTGR